MSFPEHNPNAWAVGSRVMTRAPLGPPGLPGMTPDLPGPWEPWDMTRLHIKWPIFEGLPLALRYRLLTSEFHLVLT